MGSYTPCDPATRVVMPYILPARSMGLRNRQCIYIYIYIYVGLLLGGAGGPSPLAAP